MDIPRENLASMFEDMPEAEQKKFRQWVKCENVLLRRVREWGLPPIVAERFLIQCYNKRTIPKGISTGKEEDTDVNVSPVITSGKEEESD